MNAYSKKYTINDNGTKVRVIPDYHTGGRANGPVGWLRSLDSDEPTGIALAVAGNESGAREHSISYTSIDSERISDFRIDDEPVTREAWEQAFLEACDETI